MLIFARFGLSAADFAVSAVTTKSSPCCPPRALGRRRGCELSKAAVNAMGSGPMMRATGYPFVTTRGGGSFNIVETVRRRFGTHRGAADEDLSFVPAWGMLSS
jgi:hypothetical protein